jgi:NAD(P)-dependent dehydrogenase (short-subunit alcohol dehydrogenase family)
MNSTTVASRPTAADVFDLTGRRALVTGASRGIGRAIALAFAQSGADVIGCARSENDLQETAALAVGAAGRIETHVVDLRPPESVEACVAAAATALGGLDIVVNNAAADHDSTVEETSLEVWQEVVDVNLTSCWVMARAASPYLQDGGGKLINIASVLGLVAIRNNSAYIAAKHGLVGVTRALALEWARRGVQVNAIAPGFVETAMTSAFLASEAGGRWARRQTPQGRWAQPDEIAWPAVFLASRASDFMTGQVLVVDGGQTAQ